MWKFVVGKWHKINGSGFVTEGGGMGGATVEGGLGAVLVNSLVGALFGLIFGFMLSHVARFLSMTFNRNQLTPATIERLELLSGDPQKLLGRISELEATVESLRRTVLRSGNNFNPQRLRSP